MYGWTYTAAELEMSSATAVRQRAVPVVCAVGGSYITFVSLAPQFEVISCLEGCHDSLSRGKEMECEMMRSRATRFSGQEIGQNTWNRQELFSAS
jgi:hypothetical protein